MTIRVTRAYTPEKDLNGIVADLARLAGLLEAHADTVRGYGAGPAATTAVELLTDAAEELRGALTMAIYETFDELEKHHKTPDWDTIAKDRREAEREAQEREDRE